MAGQLIKQANIFGRIGSGIGKGLGEQLPKEIERSRLASGLKELGEQKGLTPFQQFSGLASVPGVTPQMIQSGSDILRQQARGQALAERGAQQNQPTPSPFPVSKTQVEGQNISPSITQEKPLEEIQKGYIPPTREEIDSIAGEAYNTNPAFFGNDPNKAIAWAEDKADREKSINEAYRLKHENLSEIQDKVVNRLQNHSKNLGVEIPRRTYSNIEDKAVLATKPKSQGGEGLTEQQAMKKYGKELDDASRDYKAIDTIGDWDIIGRKASESLRNLKSLQSKFETRGDTEDMADLLISKNKLSPIMAYAIAEPISREPKLNQKMKSVSPIQTRQEKGVGLPINPKKQRDETLRISKELAPLLGEKGSPLAVAFELEKLGYDPNLWLDYLTNNKYDLNLRGAQERQLDKPRNVIGTMNDWWLQEWTGMGE